jgi:hypothetical protein
MKITLLSLSLILWVTVISAQEIVNLQPITAANQVKFHDVQVMLAKFNSLTGDFKQFYPFIATGHFLLIKNQGLEWDQTKPFSSKLVVTPAEIYLQIANYQPIGITKKAQPAIFSATNVFLAILNGNSKAMTDYFEVYFAGTTKQWTILLKPLDASLKKLITSVEFSGGNYIKNVTVNQAQNHPMFIELSSVQKK